MPTNSLILIDPEPSLSIVDQIISICLGLKEKLNVELMREVRAGLVMEFDGLGQRVV